MLENHFEWIKLCRLEHLKIKGSWRRQRSVIFIFILLRRQRSETANSSRVENTKTL